ncbi:AraC family transcriptional regulator [Colwelliaceae bacterium 6441]
MNNNLTIKTKQSVGLTPAIYMRKLLEVAGEFGVDKNIVLEQIDLSELELESCDMYYTVEQHFDSLRMIRKQVDIQGLGVLVGDRISIADLGIMGYAMLSSPTLRRAINVAMRFQRITDPVLHMDFHEGSKDFVITIEPLFLLGEAYRYDVEETLAIWNQILFFYFGEHAKFTQIKVTWSKPEYARMYKDTFQCKVLYDQDRNDFRFSKELLDQPLSLANDQAARICEQQCAELLRKLSKGETILDTVRRILINSPGRLPQLVEVAEKLHTSPRNLRRKLSEANTSFRQIADEVRMHLAVEYLRDTNLSIEQIAILVGYSDASNFHRAFKRYNELTPSDFRNSLQ